MGIMGFYMVLDPFPITKYIFQLDNGVFIEAVQKAVMLDKALMSKLKNNFGLNFEIGIDSFKFGVGDKSKKDDNLTLSQAFNIIDAHSDDVLLLLDEVQHLASRKEFENFTASLRSFMVNRSDSKIKGIFTGSSQDGLTRLFNETKAPFYESSQSLPFKPLGVDFVEFELDVFAQVTKGEKLDFDKSLSVFSKRNHAPGRFIELLKKMVLNMIYDIEEGDKIYSPELLASDVRSFNELLSKLTSNDVAVLKTIVRVPNEGVYSEAFKESLSIELDGLITKTVIQNSVSKLSSKAVIYSLERGKWTIDDPAFAKYISAIK